MLLAPSATATTTTIFLRSNLDSQEWNSQKAEEIWRQRSSWLLFHLWAQRRRVWIEKVHGTGSTATRSQLCTWPWQRFRFSHPFYSLEISSYFFFFFFAIFFNIFLFLFFFTFYFCTRNSPLEPLSLRTTSIFLHLVHHPPLLLPLPSTPNPPLNVFRLLIIITSTHLGRFLLSTTAPAEPAHDKNSTARIALHSCSATQSSSIRIHSFVCHSSV